MIINYFCILLINSFLVPKHLVTVRKMFVKRHGHTTYFSLLSYKPQSMFVLSSLIDSRRGREKIDRNKKTDTNCYSGSDLHRFRLGSQE